MSEQDEKTSAKRQQGVSDFGNLAERLPHPATDANKYSRGKLVLCAGSVRYPGAAALAALASQRMGAGYAEVITEASVVPLVQAAGYSLVVRSFDEWRPSSLAEVRAGHPTAAVVGCGFDAAAFEVERRVCAVLREAGAPVLVDGGGLACLAGFEARMLMEKRRDAGLATVITPHAGEAARLARALGIEEKNPDDLACALARCLHVLVVLKGENTYVSDGNDVIPMMQGTAALAKAGTGDVLAGIIGALLAQRLEPFAACLTGTLVHANAGRLAADDLTDISVVAEDVIAYIPRAIKEMEGE